ncbi:MAG: PAS domain-containing protein [Actinomycetota bacterium]
MTADDPVRTLESVAAGLAQLPAFSTTPLEHINSAIPISVIVVDAEGVVTYWSDYAEEIYGWPAEEALGKRILELIVAPSSAEQAAEIMAQLEAGMCWQGEFRARRRDGSQIDVHVIDVPTRDAEGNFTGVCGLSLDVTSQRADYRNQLDRSQALLDAMETAREGERRRIAAELHDEIGQQLSALRTQLLTIGDLDERRDDDAATVAADTRSAVLRLDVALEELRRICSELRPQLLEVVGIGPAVAELAGRFADRCCIEVDVDVDGYGKHLTPDAELQVYRVAQEALTNIERHAAAKRVTVTLLDDEVDGASATVLEVTDDGTGFEPGPKPGSLGLGIMQERARRLNATLTIDSTGGEFGTRVRLVVPSAAT